MQGVTLDKNSDNKKSLNQIKLNKQVEMTVEPTKKYEGKMTNTSSYLIPETVNRN